MTVKKDQTQKECQCQQLTLNPIASLIVSMVFMFLLSSAMFILRIRLTYYGHLFIRQTVCLEFILILAQSSPQSYPHFKIALNLEETGG